LTVDFGGGRRKPARFREDGAERRAARNMPWAIVIHGGAGNLRQEISSAEQEAACRRTLREALEAGRAVLQGGGDSLDAVEQAVIRLEDSPLFNAGKGSVFSSSGTNELDASIMSGRTLEAGAVAAVQRIRNPISLARRVMERSPHVMLTGEGAERFAREQGMTLVSREYFRTEWRWRQWREARRREAGKEPAAPPPAEEKFGTVGAVALDQNGHLAAGTSTGGMINKRYGRVGDSPLIGAGTYADDRTCAVSATGHGEYFIRLAVAHDVSALMAYRGLSVTAAAATVIHEKVAALGGQGGVIALDRRGRFAMPFNTPGMYRGALDADGRLVIRIFGARSESRE
jgi:beta-aspartyl-peptidase (threonine type)